MEKISISKNNKIIKGEITLPGSKSIANRALIIRALSNQDFNIKNLSSAKDTQTLIQLLNSKESVLNAGPAGTTFRFMTAYLSLQKGTQILTGSERMKNRPIGVLVEALKELGANIEYLEKEGYPPLKINPPTKNEFKDQIKMAADISSQYISALLMIAPTFPNGLTINFEGEPVSLPYIKMTLRMMEYFGINYEEKNNSIKVFPGKYLAKDFVVEADWSAASYYYALAALSDEAEIKINGLFEKSLQGDAVIAKIGNQFNLNTTFYKESILIKKENKTLVNSFEYDFTECPDIAQTVAIMCSALNISAKFTGLKTLRIKETDRIEALKIELNKIGILIQPEIINNKEGFILKGKCEFNHPSFDTYDDHRMALSLAPLSLFNKIEIKEPEVVNKSYPEFWEDLKSVGFLIQ